MAMHMWEKHSVWNQCALAFPATLTLACLLSCQFLTLKEDIYWTFVLCSSSALQFLAAEHGPFGYSAHLWQTLAKYKRFVVCAIMAMSSIQQWSVGVHALAFVPLCVLSIFMHKHHRLLLAAVIVHNMVMSAPWIPMLAYWCAERLSEYYFANSVQTSLADKPIKFAYGYKTATIVLETIVLWSLRCQQRFPHTFRWSPMCIGLIMSCVAFVWAELNIRDTAVSRNTIIKGLGHDVAASLIAAKACPKCRSCLTSLDMESSFGE